MAHFPASLTYVLSKNLMDNAATVLNTKQLKLFYLRFTYHPEHSQLSLLWDIISIPRAPYCIRDVSFILNYYPLDTHHLLLQPVLQQQEPVPSNEDL